MSTKIIIPRATSEDSSIGTPEKNWGDGYFDDLHCLSNFYCPLVTSDARGMGEIGESKFDTTINALIIWNGQEWLELGATTQVELVLIAGEGGTVEGAGQYSKGAPVIISAVPENSNYVFSYWNGDVSYLRDDKSAQTFVTLSKATTQLTAVFSAKTYNIFTSVEGGENDEIPGLVTTDPVGAAFPAETTITFTASTYSAFSGKYAFGFWAGEYIENNPEQRNNNPLTINSLSSDINLQAVFELQSKTITMQKYVDDDNSQLLSHFENNVELLLNGLPLPLGEGNVHEYGFGNSFTFSFSIDEDSTSYYAFDKWEIINNEGTSSQFISSTISDHTLDENIVVRAYFKAVDSNGNQIPDLYDAVIQEGEIDSDKDGIIDSYDDNILTAATSNLTVTDQDITSGLNTAYYDLEQHNTKYNISAQLTHQINFTTNSDGVVTYTSDDETVVTVSDTGLITVVGAGSATITITVPETDAYTNVYRTLDVLVTDQTDTDGDGIPDNDDTAPNQTEQTITWGQDLSGLTDTITFNATTSDEDSVITYTLSDTKLGTLEGNTFTPSNPASTGSIDVTATASATLTSFETSVTKELTLDLSDENGDGFPDINQSYQTVELQYATIAGEVGDIMNVSEIYTAQTAVTLTSSDTSIVEVVDNNTLKLVSAGTATVTYTAEANNQYYSASATQTVTAFNFTATLYLYDSIKAIQTELGGSIQIALGSNVTTYASNTTYTVTYPNGSLSVIMNLPDGKAIDTSTLQMSDQNGGVISEAIVTHNPEGPYPKQWQIGINLSDIPDDRAGGRPTEIAVNGTIIDVAPTSDAPVHDGWTMVVDSPAGVEMPGNGSAPTTDEDGNPLFLKYPANATDTQPALTFSLAESFNGMDNGNLVFTPFILLNMGYYDETEAEFTPYATQVRLTAWGPIHLIYSDSDGQAFDTPLHVGGTWDSDLDIGTDGYSFDEITSPTSGNPHMDLVRFDGFTNTETSDGEVISKDMATIHGVYGDFALYIKN